MKTMINIALIVAALVVSACGTTHSATQHENSTIRVEGVGNDVNTALKDAFKQAVEFRLGTLLLSNTVADQSAIKKDEILNYSAGYITEYNIIRKRFQHNKIIVTVDIKVASSKIRDRIIASARPDLPDTKIHAKVTSYLDSKNDAHTILNTFIKEYPTQGFKIEHLSTDVVYLDANNVEIQVRHRASWNDKWLTAFNEFLMAISDSQTKTNSSKYVVLVARNKNKVLTYDNWQFHYFNHYDFYHSVFMMLESRQNRPMLKVHFKDDWKKNKITCIPLFGDLRFFNVSYKHNNLSSLKFNSFYVQEHDIKLQVNKNDNLVKNVSNITISLVSTSECK